ncbi:IS66 family transposase [Bradyrhizobium sp. CCGB01]|uniref:IS66 family transposase n=1 Tax=Bradyrhizobium sp. CCGB01 TaxID=2949634 RepID=UPI0020B215BA|nr:IS66 family transposase [Bradyrhizobium sp. CCGB01]MCP3405705.1 IS66 family transposase [Bradyrhizobium sp. CCGB01]
MGNWSGRACPHLQPVADRMRRHLAAADRLFMDETTAPVLDPGRGQYGTEAMARGSSRDIRLAARKKHSLPSSRR